MRMRKIAFLCVLSLLFIARVHGQSPNGTISGLVVDPSGAVISGAEVIVVNEATRVQYSTKTNAEGIYVVPSLPPGPYRIQIAKIGFKTIIKPNIILHVQDALGINFTLPIGAASEVITVQGGAPLIDTESGTVSTVIDRNFVGNLPLNGRSFNTLLQLTPGVVIAPSSAAGGQPGQFSVAGQRTDANNFTVDGVSANFGVNSAYLGQSGTGNAQAFSALGGTSSLVSVDDLQEFRVETSSFAPEFGRAPGGQVILTTRSGTNEFHGGLFDYFRNTAMDANDWFSNQARIPRAPEHHNDFGAFLGGPIIRDRTFFFFSYEGARLDLPQTSSIQVPSEYSRSIAPPALAPFLNAFPLPTDRTNVSGVYTSQFTGDYANRGTLDATSIRIDHTLSGRFSIFGRYSNAPSDTLDRNYSLSTRLSTEVNTQTLTLGANMALSNSMSNMIRGNYSEQSSSLSYSQDSFGGAAPLSPGVLFDGLSAANTYGYFFTFDTNLAIMGPYGRNRAQQMNFADALTMIAGTHELKIGGDYRGIFLAVNPYHNTIALSATSVQNFLSTGQASLIAQSAVPSNILTHALSLYAQDTWKPTTRLGITYGLRWELSPAPVARGTTRLASWKNVNDLQQITLAPFGTPPWNTTFGNFAPRVGLAYSLTRDNSLVLRAGGGIFYDLSVGSSAQLATEFPNLASANYANVSVPLTNVTQYLPALSTQPPYPGVVGVTPDLKLPRSYQWNLALEKSFGQKQVISATYVGQAGRNLLRTEALYQPNANFTAEFLLTQNSARSNYNALQLQYRRSLSAGLQALLNYTWSHSLDNASNDQVVGLSNTTISAANDYASSDFDVRHSFSGAIAYSIPMVGKAGPIALATRDWSIDSVIVARTGFPFDAVLLGVSPDPGGAATSRPDLVAGQPFWISSASAPGGKILNANAFSIPPTIRQGTEGRNDIPGFGLTQVDLSISRNFPITERIHLQFRADAFNLFNHPNFTNPLAYIQYGSFYLQSQSMLNEGLGGLSSLFQEGGPRSLQLSLKLLF
jgi:hypothetical protein